MTDYYPDPTTKTESIVYSVIAVLVVAGFIVFMILTGGRGVL